MYQNLEVAGIFILQFLGDSLSGFGVNAGAGDGELVSSVLETEAGATLGNQSELVILGYDLHCVLGLHDHETSDSSVTRAGCRGHRDLGSGQVSSAHSHLQLQLASLLIEVRRPTSGLQ